MIITTKNFQYRCNGLSTSEESITLVSPVEKTRYVYSLNKKVNTGYLKSTKTKELGVWSFLYIWWFCMHNEWQYIAINFLLPLYILNNLFLFMDYWITCKQGQTNLLYYWLLPSISVHINLQYAWGNNATFNEAMLHTFGILTELKAEIKKSCVISSETLLSRGLFLALLLQETVKRSTVGYKKPFCCDVIPITSPCNGFHSISMSIFNHNPWDFLACWSSQALLHSRINLKQASGSDILSHVIKNLPQKITKCIIINRTS